MDLGAFDLLALLFVGVLVATEGLGVGEFPVAVLALVFAAVGASGMGRGEVGLRGACGALAGGVVVEEW